MRIIDLAAKDLLQIFRDWRAAIFLVVMPIAFTLLFGFAFGGFGGVEEEDPRLPVVYIRADTGTSSEHLINLLGDSQVIRIEQSDEGIREKLHESVSDNDVAGALIIPAGTVVSTSDSAHRFNTQRDGRLPAGPGEEVEIPIEALSPGSAALRAALRERSGGQQRRQRRRNAERLPRRP